MQTKDGLVQVLDALTGRQITEAPTDVVGAFSDEVYEDVTNYSWIARQLDITVSEAKELYGKE
jgi:hypothetical protein